MNERRMIHGSARSTARRERVVVDLDRPISAGVVVVISPGVCLIRAVANRIARSQVCQALPHITIFDRGAIIILPFSHINTPSASPPPHPTPLLTNMMDKFLGPNTHEASAHNHFVSVQPFSFQWL
jgi:hypothetical protein